MAEYRLICCVVTTKTASKTLRVAKRYGIKGGTISMGRGTVHSRMLDILGLSEVRKEIVTMVVEAPLASAAIKGISHHMHFNKPHHGIAFMLPVSQFIGAKTDITTKTSATPPQTSQTDEVKNSMYQIIYVVVERGKANDVIETANAAGARGGTIVNARGSGIHEVQKLFSLEIEPEKEEVFIITKAELKDAIVDAICRDLKIDQPGNGILFVMDINEVHGLRAED